VFEESQLLLLMMFYTLKWISLLSHYLRKFAIKIKKVNVPSLAWDRENEAKALIHKNMKHENLII
jgi:hypothetical protein